jgi:uncharacterized membrane protein
MWTGALLLIVFLAVHGSSVVGGLEFVLPASSFGYVLNVAMAHYFLLESVSMARWCGTAMIFAGVIMVMAGSRSGRMGEWQGHK